MKSIARSSAIVVVLLLVSSWSAVRAADIRTAPPGVVPTPAITGAPSVGIATSLLVNGDFETNSYPPNGCFFNQANATINANMPGITAYGAANEIDATKSPTNCLFGGAPQSGQSKLCLHRQSAQSGGIVDEFSFQLTGPVVAGNPYTVTFYAWSVLDSDPDIGSIDIGLSSSASAFGTAVYTSPPPSTSSWSFMSTSFVAPVNASFMTVRVSPGVQAWIHVDNFALEPGGATALAPRTWGRLKTLYRD